MIPNIMGYERYGFDCISVPKTEFQIGQVHKSIKTNISAFIIAWLGIFSSP